MKRNCQLLNAIIARLKAPSSWPALPKLVPYLPSEIDTEMGLLAGLRAAWVFGRCASNGIAWDSIDQNDLLPDTLATGAQVLLPEPGVLKEAGRVLTGSRSLHLAEVGRGMRDTVSQ